MAAASAFRIRLRARLAALLGNDGVLLMPTMPDVAPRISDDGLSGFPQLSLPLAPQFQLLDVSELQLAGWTREALATAQIEGEVAPGLVHVVSARPMIL